MSPAGQPAKALSSAAASCPADITLFTLSRAITTVNAPRPTFIAVTANPSHPKSMKRRKSVYSLNQSLESLK